MFRGRAGRADGDSPPTFADDPWNPAVYDVAGEAPPPPEDHSGSVPPRLSRSLPRRRWELGAVIVALVAVVAVVAVRWAKDDASTTSADTSSVSRAEAAVPITTPSNSSGTLSPIPPIGQRRTSNSTPNAPGDGAADSSVGSSGGASFPTFSSSGTMPASAVPTTLPSTPSVPAPLGPLAAGGDGLGLYVTNGFGGPSSNVRIDIATGTITPLDRSYDPFEAVGVVGSGTHVRFLTRADLGGDVAAPCSDGTWWVAKSDSTGNLGTLQRVRPHVDVGTDPDIVQSVVISRTLQAMDPTEWTAAGDLPVLTAPDGHSYRLDPVTGVLQRFGTGRIETAGHGSFAETICDDTNACATQLHGAAGPSTTTSVSAQQFVSFSPDGLHALLVAMDDPAAVNGGQAARVTLLNLSTGTSVLVRTTTSGGLFSAGFAPRLTTWTPDGATGFILDGADLVVVDVATETTRTVRLPDFLQRGSMILVGVV